MPSVAIEPKKTKSGTRYLVRYRLGGRDSPKVSLGTVKLERDAKALQRWAISEMVANRVPIRDFGIEASFDGPILREAADKWMVFMRAVPEGTKATYRTSLSRILPILGDRPINSITHEDVSAMNANFHEDQGLSYTSIRKTRGHLGAILEYADIDPPPTKHKHVWMPPKDEKTIIPPSAPDITKVFYKLPVEYRLPLLVIESGGQRITEFELTEVGDLDDTDTRFRLRKEAVKGKKKARLCPIDPSVFAAIVKANPIKSRTNLKRQLFDGFSGDAFRTSLTRACEDAGVTHIYPHLLRHRRATLLHLNLVPAVEAAERLGHSTATQLLYVHATLQDRSEIDYEKLIKTLP